MKRYESYKNINRCPFLRRFHSCNICCGRTTEEILIATSHYAEYCLSKRYRGCGIYLRSLTSVCNKGVSLTI